MGIEHRSVASGRHRVRAAVGVTTAVLLVVASSSLQLQPADAAGGEPYTYPVLLSAQEAANIVVRSDSDVALHEFIWDSSTASFEAVDDSKAFSSRLIEGDRLISLVLETAPDGTIVGRTVNHARADHQEADNVAPLQWSAGTNGVTLSWSVVTDTPVNWTITRDGVVVHEGTEQMFTDAEGDRAANHDYLVTGEETVTHENQTFLKPYTFKVTVPATDASSLGSRLDDRAIVGPDHNQDIAAFEPSDRLLIDPIIDRTHQWETFIPDHPVPVPPACVDTLATGAVWFGGDDRTFKLNRLYPGTFRTRITIPFTFTGYLGTADLWPGTPLGKDVGYTHTYDADGLPLNSDQASSNGIYVDYDESTNDFGSYSISHAVADPLCAVAAPIDYYLNYSANNLGWMSISGYHDQAPSHEAFYQASNDAMAYEVNWCWYRFDNRGLEWLLGFGGSPFWPQAYVDLDVNPLVAPPSCTII